MSARRRRWWLAAALVVPVLGAGVLAHTRAGRALFGEKCPWEGAPPSAERLESFRVKSAASLKGSTRAPARPAFGFVLDVSTRADVTAWGTRVGATCREEIAGAALRCESAGQPIGAKSALPVKDAFFRFDPRGVLVGVDLMRDGTNGEKAAAVLTTITAQIAEVAGPPSTVQGTASSAHLSGYMNRAGSEFRFANYAADVSATNLGEQGVVVREQYRSIPN
jgi:hypothetical protein